MRSTDNRNAPPAVACVPARACPGSRAHARAPCCPWAQRLVHRGQEGHVPHLLGEGGPQVGLWGPPLGDHQPVVVGGCFRGGQGRGRGKQPRRRPRKGPPRLPVAVNGWWGSGRRYGAARSSQDAWALLALRLGLTAVLLPCCYCTAGSRCSTWCGTWWSGTPSSSSASTSSSTGRVGVGGQAWKGRRWC